MIPATAETHASVCRHLHRIDSQSPAGYSIGVTITRARAGLSRTTFSSAWLSTYSRNHMAFCDPAIVWGVANEGAMRWSDIQTPDPFDILGHAAAHGLRFGTVIAVGVRECRSILLAARGDREFHRGEIDDLQDSVAELHTICRTNSRPSDRQIAALEYLSLGYTYAEICQHLAISRTALKARLRGARRALGAKRNATAVRLASEYSLFGAQPIPGVSYCKSAVR